MKDRQLWADFNDLDPRGDVRSHTRFVEPGVSLVAGEAVIVGDDEGNRAMAEVVNVSGDGLVELRVDLGSFEVDHSLTGLSAS